MKVLHISDIHCASSILEKLLENENYDLIVASGDFECKKAIELLATTPKSVRVLAVPGNMDHQFIVGLLDSEKLNVDGRLVKVGKYNFVGIGGLNLKSSVKKVLECLKRVANVDFVISHIPPKKTRVDKALGFIHAGSVEVRKLIEEVKPKAVFCGHIHESKGVDSIGDTLVVNAGPLGVDGSYAIVDLESLKVEFRRVQG